MEEEQTTQWPKEKEEQTTQWPKEKVQKNKQRVLYLRKITDNDISP
jgi:hypothetical protein